MACLQKFCMHVRTRHPHSSQRNVSSGWRPFCTLDTVLLVQLLDKWCGKRFVPVALALTTLALLAAGVMMGFLYASFAPSASCARNIAFITFTLLICLALVAMTIVALRLHEGGLIPTNLFTVAVLCPYLFWLCAAALASAPRDGCAPEGPDRDAWYGVRTCRGCSARAWTRRSASAV